MSIKLMAGNARKLIYQIWMPAWPSFKAVAEHIEYLKGLDIDYVWLSPIFVSPMADGGYDVQDYNTVDPRFGSMADFDEFVLAMGKQGVGVLLDLPLNHTSSRHEWFRRALEEDKKYMDCYLFTEDLGWGNWFNGGSAFEPVSWGKDYVHLFGKEQPDLNWRNRSVRAEFKRIIKFWSDEHGVAGFRLDSVPFLVKNLHRTILPRELFGAYAGVAHYYMLDETIEVLDELFGDTSLFTMGEAGIPLMHYAKKLAGLNGPLSATLNITVPDKYESIGRLRRELRKWSKFPWYVASLESHDRPRITSLTGLPGEDLVAMMLEGRPQYVCLYQGQEFGLKNPKLSIDQLRSDIMFEMKYGVLEREGRLSAKNIEKLKSTARAYAREPLPLPHCYEQCGGTLDAVIDLFDKWKNA